ncbi:MAG: ABC transporter permease [Acidimicrobiia bacterium]
MTTPLGRPIALHDEVSIVAPETTEIEIPAAGWRHTIRRFRRQRVAMAGVVILVILVAAGALAPLLAPHDPAELVSTPFGSPSGDFLLGTDEIGRDLLSRLLYGMRFSLLASFIAVLASVSVGSAIGLVSGYVGGWIDYTIMRVTDAILAFPGLLIAMAIVGVLGPGVVNAMLGLSIAFMPLFVRLVRGEVLAIRAEPYVEAARVAGVRARRIIRRHVIPNMLPPVLVQALTTMAIALLAEGALSFLGLSVQPPNSSLGKLLQSGFTYVAVTPRLILAPGIVLTLLAWSFNSIADGLRESLSVRESVGVAG